MPFVWDDGHRITNDSPVDDRMVYETVEEVLTTLPFGRRYDGLAIWIRQKKLLYRFIGGTSNDHFVPDMVTTEVIEAIIAELQDKFFETLFNTETLNTLTELFSASVEFKRAFWSKEELRVMSPTAYTDTNLPEGTVVMLKEQ